MDALQLTLNRIDLFLIPLTLHKNLIQLLLESLIVVLDMLISVLDILWTGVGPKLVQCQVVVGKLPLKLTYLVVQLLEPSLHLVVQLLLLYNQLAFIPQFGCLLLHTHLLFLCLSDVVVAIVDLSVPGLSLRPIHSAPDGHRSINDVYSCADPS